MNEGGGVNSNSGFGGISSCNNNNINNGGATSSGLININKEDHKLVVNQEQLLLMQKEFSKQKIHQKDLILPDLNHNLHFHNSRRVSVIKQRRVSLSSQSSSPTHFVPLEFSELTKKRSASPVKTHQQRSSSTISFNQQHRKFQSFHSPLALEVSKR